MNENLNGYYKVNGASPPTSIKAQASYIRSRMKLNTNMMMLPQIQSVSMNTDNNNSLDTGK